MAEAQSCFHFTLTHTHIHTAEITELFLLTRVAFCPSAI